MEALQKRAEAERVSVDELAESLLKYSMDELYHPSPSEIAELEKAKAEYEANKARGIVITQKDMDRLLVETVATLEQQRRL